MTADTAPTTAELNRIISYIGLPVSPEFAVNRWPQDVPMLVRTILNQRRDMAELARVLHTLPLDAQPDDTPLQLVERAQAFWLEYQQGLWEDRETARLKAAKEKSDRAVEAGKRREEKLAERITWLEQAEKDAQVAADALHTTINEMTNSLAGATGREAAHAARVQVLEHERAELEAVYAMDKQLLEETRAASEVAWRDVVTEAMDALAVATNALRTRMGR